ncbi:MAG: SOS response-associated peptidase [Solirubrobacterales bacterium]
MCGRYKLQDPDWVEADFSTSFPTLSDAVRRPRFNVAPGQLVLAITRGSEARALEQMDWGIEAPWEGGPPQIINARAEKLSESRFWKPMLERRRCAIPADGFYEWKAPAETGGNKQPYLFTREGGEGFWFAGVYAKSQGDEPAADHQCAIVTVDPNELVEGVHDRMPAMLHADELDDWLGDDTEAAFAVLQPFPSVEMSALAIGRAIGNPRNEGPELIERAEPEGPAQAQLI